MNLLTALDQDVEIVIRAEAPVAEGWPNQRRRGLNVAPGDVGAQVLSLSAVMDAVFAQ
jgi:hypothetical protein